MRTALTIAGSDSGGGAGIQADLKTFAAHDVHGVCAVTAVTAQNTVGVTTVGSVSAALVATQIVTVMDDFDVVAIKTGMLATRAIVAAVCDQLQACPDIPLVVDPVLVSTSRAAHRNAATGGRGCRPPTGDGRWRRRAHWR